MARRSQPIIGARADEAIVGPSTSINVYVLANALGSLLKLGDEIIVINLDHDANIGA